MQPVLGRLGEAIAALHEAGAAVLADPPPGILPFRRLDPARLAQTAEVVAGARPDVAGLAGRVGRRLAAGPPDDGEEVLLHGDCQPKNALIDGERVALIDLDLAAVGAPAADIGSLLARVRHDAVLAGASAEASEALGTAFLDGYARVRPLPSAASLDWHVAAALLAERALRAVTRVQSRRLDRLGWLLETAESVARSR